MSNLLGGQRKLELEKQGTGSGDREIGWGGTADVSGRSSYV